MSKILKRVICLFCICLAQNSVSAEDLQTNPTPKVYEYKSNVPKGLFMAQYQISDFRSFEYSGIYGFKDLLSVYQKDNNHACVSFGVLANYGIIDPDAMFVTLGPAYRVDISKTASLSIPLELMCGISSHNEYDREGNLNTKYDINWSGCLNIQLIIMPDKVGFFLGPQLLFNQYATSFGAVAGICF